MIVGQIKHFFLTTGFAMTYPFWVNLALKKCEFIPGFLYSISRDFYPHIPSRNIWIELSKQQTKSYIK